MTATTGSDALDELTSLPATIASHGERYFAVMADRAAHDHDAAAVLAVADTLAGSISLLRKLPGFEENRGLDALHDLLLALHTIAEGGKPALLQTRVKGVGQDPVGRRFIKYNAVLCVRVLVDLGLRDKAAREFVAKSFTAAGHRGRKGGPLSAATIFEWTTECGAGCGDPQGEEWLASHLSAWRSDPNWPPPLATAKAWIKGRAADPLLVSKI
jgi:hypothetical protein